MRLFQVYQPHCVSTGFHGTTTDETDNIANLLIEVGPDCCENQSTQAVYARLKEVAAGRMKQQRPIGGDGRVYRSR